MSGDGCLTGPIGCGPITFARFPRSGIGRSSALTGVVLDITPWRALARDVFGLGNHPDAIDLFPANEQGARTVLTVEACFRHELHSDFSAREQLETLEWTLRCGG